MDSGDTPAVATIDCSNPPAPAIVSRSISAHAAMPSMRSIAACRAARPPARLGAMNPATPRSSAAIGHRVIAPTMTAAPIASATRSVKCSTLVAIGSAGALLARRGYRIRLGTSQGDEEQHQSRGEQRAEQAGDQAHDGR